MAKYNINENFFDELNEDSLYILGYLYANGSVYKHELTISGTEPDLMQQMLDAMESNHPIKKSGSYKCRVGNKALVLKLRELGLVNGKTNNLRYPNFLPEDLEHHFIRGYFDGKGSFMVEPGRRIVCNISAASMDFIEGLRDRLVLHGLNTAEIHQYGAQRATNVIRYYVYDTRRLFRLLYDEARIYSREHTAKFNRGI